jgi:hypothetical protein
MQRVPFGLKKDPEAEHALGKGRIGDGDLLDRGWRKLDADHGLDSFLA